MLNACWMVHNRKFIHKYKFAIYKQWKMVGCYIMFHVLLGNMWAQNWEALLDLLVPGLKTTNLTAALRARNYSTFDIVHHAENFYVSLGLEPMTHSFWKHSQIERPVDSNGTCHGTAANMYQPGDYRYSIKSNISCRWLALLLCIWEILGLNLGLETSFSHHLYANAETKPQIRPSLLPSISAIILHSLVI